MNQDLINSQQNPRRGIPPGYKGTHFKIIQTYIII